MTKLQFKLNRKSMFIWMGITSVMVLGFMAFFPTMADENLQILMEGMSDSILQVLGFETFPNFSEIDQFYGYIIQYVNMALLVYALTLGLNTFIKEEKEGTIEFIYAQNMSRTQFVKGKLMGNLITLSLVELLLIILSCVTFYIFTPSSTEAITIITSSIPVFIIMTLCSMMFLLLGTGLSLILKSTISISGLALGIVFIPYVLGMMAQMVASLKSFEFISIIHTTMPDRIYGGNYDYLSYGLWCVLSIVIFLYGFHTFKTRDIKV